MQNFMRELVKIGILPGTEFDDRSSKRWKNFFQRNNGAKVGNGGT